MPEQKQQQIKLFNRQIESDSMGIRNGIQDNENEEHKKMNRKEMKKKNGIEK